MSPALDLPFPGADLLARSGSLDLPRNFYLPSPPVMTVFVTHEARRTPGKEPRARITLHLDSLPTRATHSTQALPPLPPLPWPWTGQQPQPHAQNMIGPARAPVCTPPTIINDWRFIQKGFLPSVERILDFFRTQLWGNEGRFYYTSMNLNEYPLFKFGDTLAHSAAGARVSKVINGTPCILFIV